MTDEKGVGSLPDAGTIQPGDPGHIETHDEMARLMQVAADSLGIILDPPAPKPAVIGEYGHVDAHNTLLANIEQLAAAGGGGLPGEGLGDWAEIKSVTGSPKRYAYNDGDTDWVAFEWTVDGEVTTQAGGLVDCFLISGGGGTQNYLYGNAGNVVSGLHTLDTTNPVSVGDPGPNPTPGDGSDHMGRPSSVGPVTTITAGHTYYGYNGGIGAGATIQDNTAPFISGITGNDEEYGRVNQTTARANKGDGGSGMAGASTRSSAGVVIVRVPAEQAAGVSPGSWVTRVDYYAEVTDGIVTDLYQERFYGDDTVRTENGSYASPEQPDDLIPCDPMVAEGWSYDGKDFTPPPPPPPPTRDEIIAELQARIDELTKDVK